MTSAAVLLILHLRRHFPSLRSQAVFGTATGVSRRHFLKVGIGETGGAVVQPLLRGCRQRGDASPRAAAVVGLEEEGEKGGNG